MDKKDFWNENKKLIEEEVAKKERELKEWGETHFQLDGTEPNPNKILEDIEEEFLLSPYFLDEWADIELHISNEDGFFDNKWDTESEEYENEREKINEAWRRFLSSEELHEWLESYLER